MWAGSSMKFNCPPFRREFTRLPIESSRPCPSLDRVKVGLLNVFVQHTSASLTINENADPDVLYDLNQSLAALAPEDAPYRHVEEGPDDMPAHVKASLMGCSLTIPIRNGQLCLGIWQGICLCEHRRHGGRRRLVLTLQGDADA